MTTALGVHSGRAAILGLVARPRARVADRAGDLEQALQARVDAAGLVRGVVGPSIAVHIGLGTVGCVVAGG